MKKNLLLAALLLLGGLGTPVLAQTKSAAKSTRPAFRQLGHSAQRATAVVRPGQAITYTWDDAAHAWVDPVRLSYTYNGQGNPTQEVAADSTSGTNLSRVQYTYDAQGRNTQELDQLWSGGAWQNQSRYIASYDTQGNLTEELQENWRNNTWSTSFGSRYANGYTNNVLTSVTQTVWDNGSYVNSRRELYTLVNGQWNTVTYQTWAANNWQDEDRFVNLVWTNWNLKQPASFTAEHWAIGWAVASYATMTYPANGGVVTLEQVPGPNNTRVNYFRISELYDAYGNPTNYREEQWLTNAWQLENESRDLLSYNAARSVTRRTTQQYDGAIPGFVNQERFNYSGFLTITRAASAGASAQVALFPTITTDRITVQLSGPAAGRSGEVLNALGQPVLRVALPTLTTTLDVTTLSAGVYTLRVLTPQGMAVKRFVRQ